MKNVFLCLWQVGPTGARAFHEFLVRLQLRCVNDDHNHLKELLLKLVYTLAAERCVTTSSFIYNKQDSAKLCVCVCVCV